MADSLDIEIKGLAGNFQAEPRVFAHSANAITIASGAGKDEEAQDVVPLDPAGDQAKVLNRGACLYVGVTGNVKVLLEGDSTVNKTTGVVTDVPVTFQGVPAGSFLPVLVTKIYGKDGTDGTTADGIIALF